MADGSKEMTMHFWNDPRFQEIIRQVLIALFLALLSVLGYDKLVAQRRGKGRD